MFIYVYVIISQSITLLQKWAKGHKRRLTNSEIETANNCMKRSSASNYN